MFLGIRPAGVKELSHVLCAELAPHSLALTDSFGMTDKMLSGPIGKWK